MTVKPVNKYPIIFEVHLESICALIADTNEGLSGSEITKILGDCRIADYSPGLNKRGRLYAALANYQNIHQCSNGVLKFLQQALNPARYFNKEELLNYRLNVYISEKLTM